VNEWLEKDGRCPICRHQVRPVTSIHVDGDRGMAGLRSLAGAAFLVLESRRLMMLATVEAALAILVMSYVADLISPGLMIFAAVVTFFGASHYLPKTVYASIPLLFCNALYHVFLMTQIVHQQQGAAFFSEDYGAARTVLLSIGCVTFMELATLKKASAFNARLRATPAVELRALRMQRRIHTGWTQRVIIAIMFLLIFAPLIARYVCGSGHNGATTCRH